jgi:flagellar assembly protein FliH
MMIMSNMPLDKNIPLIATRWELNTLKENKQDLSKNPLIAKLAQELINSKEKAVEEGFAKGFEDGKHAGYSEGLNTAMLEGQQQIQETVNYLSEITFNLQKLYSYSREHITQEIIDLAIDLARAVTMRSIEKQPDIIFDVVEKALEQVPILQLPAKILLNPKDALLIEANQGRSLSEAGWRIVHDHEITRGGCRLETGSNDVDATVEKRFEKMMATLGKDPSLQPESTL